MGKKDELLDLRSETCPRPQQAVFGLNHKIEREMIRGTDPTPPASDPPKKQADTQA